MSRPVRNPYVASRSEIPTEAGSPYLPPTVVEVPVNMTAFKNVPLQSIKALQATRLPPSNTTPQISPFSITISWRDACMILSPACSCTLVFASRLYDSLSF